MQQERGPWQHEQARFHRCASFEARPRRISEFPSTTEVITSVFVMNLTSSTELRVPGAPGKQDYRNHFNAGSCAPINGSTCGYSLVVLRENGDVATESAAPCRDGLILHCFRHPSF
ncbi:expressed unknown protein [Seminavis robusta]|uniref:Uncharacterized protein n=1 Tax=Seminavis robusta TaxID=568900 RepID=A0A9N8DKQ8_9STRA|nr:expressed unknown protein [Seminavis robusta]|eukprot:Sro136_g064051.1  (116) ;mRNA; f:42747-43094